MADCPTVIGKYQLGEVLGRGAFAAVYKGLDSTTGDIVAVKMLKVSKIKAQQLHGIMSEVDLMQRLDHSNIVRFLDCSRHENWLAIVIEYVEGGSLQSMQKKFGNPSEELVSRYISQVLQGLAYLHEQGVVHRDIKGANILTTKQGTVKLADFGVATSQLKESEVNVAGTPYWMAPEIIELSGATFASDIWSVGCTIIELLTGAPPYYDLAPMSALFRIVQDDTPPLPTKITPTCRDFLQLCFQKDPNLRVSAANLLLHRWIKGKTEAIAKPRVQSAAVSASLSSLAVIPVVEIGHVASDEPERPVPAKKDKKLKKKKKGSSKQSKDRGSGKDRSGAHIKADKKKSASLRKKKKDEVLSKSSVPKAKAVVDDSLPASSARHSSPLDAAPSTGRAATLAPSTEDSKDAPRRPTRRGLKEASKSISAMAHKRPSADAEDDDFFADFDADDGPGAGAAGAGGAARLSLVGASTLSDSDETSSTSSESSDSDQDLRGGKLQKAAPGVAGASSAAGAAARASPRVTQTGKFDISKYTERDDGDDDEFDDGLDLVELEDVRRSSGSSGGGSLVMRPVAGGSAGRLAVRSLVADTESVELELSDGEDDEADKEAVELTQVASTINQMVLQLVSERDEDAFVQGCAALVDTIKVHSREKSYWVRHHGAVTVLEIFDQQSEKCLHSMLLVVNEMIAGNDVIKENLCLIGGLPVIMRLASQGSSFRIRQQAAQFLREMFMTSVLTLQMFMACSGISVLVTLLQYCVDAFGRCEALQCSEDDVIGLARMCVDGVYQVVFNLKDSKLPRNDFCRLFVRTGLSQPMAEVLVRLLRKPDSARAHIEKLVEVIGVLAVQDSVVKLSLTNPSVLDRLLSCIALIPVEQLTKLLRAFKALSSDSRTLPSFTQVRGVERLAKLMDRPEAQLQSALLPCLFNLCRIDRDRQREAVRCGLIPYFLSVFRGNGAQKQFAIQILCELAHNGDARGALWELRGADVLLEILRKEIKTAWPKTVLESLNSWFENDSRIVDVLVTNVAVIVDAVLMHSSFSPLEAITRNSAAVPFCCALAESRLVDAILDYEGRLKLMNPLDRIAAMKILNTIISAASLTVAYYREHDISAKVRVVYASDNSVVVRRLAKFTLEIVDGKKKV